MDIALISTNRKKFSETFIHNQALLLPAKVHYMHGGYLPEYVSMGPDDFGKAVVSESGSNFWRRLLGKREVTDKKALLQDALTAYLEKHSIRAVLASYGPSGVEMMPVCKRAKVPLIVYFYGYDAFRNDMMASHGERYPEMFSQAEAILTVSKHMGHRLVELGAPEEKVIYNPPGVDPAMFSFSDPGKNPPHFLAIGRFSESKSPHLTILAFNEAKKHIPEASLTIVGDGHLKEACQILVKALGIEADVEFTGALSHEDLADQYRKARAFVQHSLVTPSNDTEGTPVSVLEACASGLPVISTLHGGIPEVVLDGKTGFLSAEYDYGKMAESMIRLGKDPRLASEMGLAAHKHAISHFSMQRHIDILWKIIQEVIERNN